MSAFWCLDGESAIDDQGVRREVLEGTGIEVHVERLTGVYKTMPCGIVFSSSTAWQLAASPNPTTKPYRYAGSSLKKSDNV